MKTFEIQLYSPAAAPNRTDLDHHWWLLSPYGPYERRQHWESDRPYACDNGAWVAYKRGLPFDESLFRRFLDRRAEGANWVVVPDVVGNRDGTIEMFHRWQPVLGGLPLMFALQGGMEQCHVEELVPKLHGLFLGGSIEYKLDTVKSWGEWADDNGLHFHVARANSVKRIKLFEGAGAHSCDGSSAVRFPNVSARLNRYINGRKRQVRLFGG